MLEIIFESFGDLFKGFDAFLKTRDLTIGAILAWIAPFILIWIKISKEKEKRSRSQLIERRQLQIAFNINEIIEHLGVQSKWNLQEIGSTHTVQPSSKPWLTIFMKVIQKMKSLYPRRKKMMIFTKLGKKFWLAILGAIIPVVNVQFGINLDLNTMIGMWTILGVGIAALAHVDGKHALAAANVVKVAVTADPNLTYKDLIKTVNIVHNAITETLADLQKDDGSAAFHVAADAYVNLLSIVNDFKKPKPLPDIPSQQESA